MELHVRCGKVVKNRCTRDINTTLESAAVLSLSSWTTKSAKCIVGHQSRVWQWERYYSNVPCTKSWSKARQAQGNWNNFQKLTHPMHISFFQIGHKQNHWLFHLIWDKFNRFIDLQRWVHTATPCFDGTSYPGMTQLVKCHCHGSTQLGFHERLQRPQSHLDLGISLYDSKRCPEICELRLPSKTKKT